MCLRVQVVPILSEDVNEPVVVRLALGEANGGGVQVLLEQSLQLRFGVILIQAFHLCVRLCVGGSSILWKKYRRNWIISTWIISTCAQGGQ